jgi:hypothetical protein
VPVLFAQSLGEYGALSGIASSLQAFGNRVQLALQEPRHAALAIAAALVLGYFLLRRR